MPSIITRFVAMADPGWAPSNLRLIKRLMMMMGWWRRNRGRKRKRKEKERREKELMGIERCLQDNTLGLLAALGVNGQLNTEGAATISTRNLTSEGVESVTSNSYGYTAEDQFQESCNTARPILKMPHTCIVLCHVPALFKKLSSTRPTPGH